MTTAATATGAGKNALKRACVIGWPIGHSRSPLIHGYWLEEHGLADSYERVAVPPEQIDGFFADFTATGGYVGGNVTIPHKEAAFRAMAHVDETARALSACNTFWLDAGTLWGSNTDVYGFLANLDAGAPGWDQRRGTALVLGAGGAARAVVFGLKQRGFDRVLLANRTIARAQELAQDFGAMVIEWADLPRAMGDTDLLVNTTSLGMTGQPPLELDLAPLSPKACVTDIVYVPLETPLLSAAKARGNRVVDGLGMLLHQAVPGFERWFGVRPDVTEVLRAKIVADLLASQ